MNPSNLLIAALIAFGSIEAFADEIEINPEVYIGLTGGYVRGDLGGAVDPFDGSLDGFEGGVLVGVQAPLQRNFFAGFELDGVFTTASARDTQRGTIVGFPFAFHVKAHQDWLFSARGRIGRSFNRISPYVTGGLAIGKTTATGTLGFLGTVTQISGDQVNWGLVGGGGIGFALTDRISIRQEARFTHLFDRNDTDFQAFSGRAALVFRLSGGK